MQDTKSDLIDVASDAVKYFLTPENIKEKIDQFYSLENLSGQKNYFVENYLEGDVSTWCFDFGSGIVLFSEAESKFTLELFDCDRDTVNAMEEIPNWLLSRGKDDATWNVVFNENNASLETENFEYLTNFFYMSPDSLYEITYEKLLNEKAVIPKWFTPENVRSIILS